MEANVDAKGNSIANLERKTLQAMLQRKRQREEDEEAMKARVHAEMSMIMDTGVRVNPLLASRRAES